MSFNNLITSHTIKPVKNVGSGVYTNPHRTNIHNQTQQYGNTGSNGSGQYVPINYSNYLSSASSINMEKTAVELALNILGVEHGYFESLNKHDFLSYYEDLLKKNNSLNKVLASKILLKYKMENFYSDSDPIITSNLFKYNSNQQVQQAQQIQQVQQFNQTQQTQQFNQNQYPHFEPANFNPENYVGNIGPGHNTMLKNNQYSQNNQTNQYNTAPNNFSRQNSNSVSRSVVSNGFQHVQNQAEPIQPGLKYSIQNKQDNEYNNYQYIQSINPYGAHVFTNMDRNINKNQPIYEYVEPEPFKLVQSIDPKTSQQYLASNQTNNLNNSSHSNQGNPIESNTIYMTPPSDIPRDFDINSIIDRYTHSKNNGLPIRNIDVSYGGSSNSNPIPNPIKINQQSQLNQQSQPNQLSQPTPIQIKTPIKNFRNIDVSFTK